MMIAMHPNTNNSNKKVEENGQRGEKETFASMENLLHVMADSRISIKGSGFHLSVQPHFPISLVRGHGCLTVDTRVLRSVTTPNSVKYQKQQRRKLLFTKVAHSL